MKPPRKLTLASLLLMGSFALGTTLAQAQFLYYANTPSSTNTTTITGGATQFSAAVAAQGPSFTETFESLNVPANGFTQPSVPFTLNGVTYNNTRGYAFAPNGSGFGATVNDGSTVLTFDNNTTLTLSSTRVNAVGFQSYSLGDANTTIRVTDSAGNTSLVVIADTPSNGTTAGTAAGSPNNVGFVGIIDRTPGAYITSVTVFADAADNVIFGSVPEPTTWAMLLIGAGLLVRMMVARRRSA